MGGTFESDPNLKRKRESIDNIYRLFVRYLKQMGFLRKLSASM